MVVLFVFLFNTAGRLSLPVVSEYYFCYFAHFFNADVSSFCVLKQMGSIIFPLESTLWKQWCLQGRKLPCSNCSCFTPFFFLLRCWLVPVEESCRVRLSNLSPVLNTAGSVFILGCISQINGMVLTPYLLFANMLCIGVDFEVEDESLKYT